MIQRKQFHARSCVLGNTLKSKQNMLNVRKVVKKNSVTLEHKFITINWP